ncbi:MULTISPECIES: MFS transporter [unclassified Cryobacterium]|uniref:MFS transporter n=1 Tax=unclassified Cryobacterium TaxID=2649013 RepID=UPI00106CEFBC|nr:MFS transporter [Cryobacterium sp. TMB3-1-2]TFC68375.1 MFS transporter [Cryobacterium sp. TMB3-15]TFC74925.1 MFS transporter [Cryobacterium sp. TMB3-10]TFD38415.1 MFS transporter [Cryobacterium sp. TMB3-12]
MYISFSDRGSAQGTASPPGRPVATRVSSVVIALGIVSLVTDVSSESVSAILPLYITGVLGLSTVAYGLLDGIYQGVSAIVRIAGGWAADRGDQPKWIAFFGYGLSVLARTGLLFATGFTSLAAVIAVDRLGKGVRTAPRDALITASSLPENLGRSFGVHRMLDTVGAAVGPLLAFAILFAIPDGYDTVFVVSLAFAIVGVFVLGLVVPNTRPSAERAAPGTSRASFRWAQLRDPRLRRLLLTAGLLGIVTIGDGFIYLVLQSRDAFAAAWFPLLYVGTNVVFLLLAIPLGKLADRFGRARVFVCGHLALLSAYASAAVPVAGLPTTILCLIALGAFYASTDGILAALAAQSTSEASRATAIASAQTVVAATRLIASTGFGVLWFAVGRGDAMLIIAGALALLIPLAALVLRGAFDRTQTT